MNPIEPDRLDAGHIGPDTERLIDFHERALTFAHELFAKDGA